MKCDGCHEQLEEVGLQLCPTCAAALPPVRKGIAGKEGNMDTFDMYLPHAKRWLEKEYGEYSKAQAESLAYLLAGCRADGEMAGERNAKAHTGGYKQEEPR